jgi:hypothetical protein
MAHSDRFRPSGHSGGKYYLANWGKCGVGATSVLFESPQTICLRLTELVLSSPPASSSYLAVRLQNRLGRWRLSSASLCAVCSVQLLLVSNVLMSLGHMWRCGEIQARLCQRTKKRGNAWRPAPARIYRIKIMLQ